MKLVGSEMSKQTCDQALKMANTKIDDVQVVELHDCFSCNELITYESLGLCPEGKAGEAIDKN